MELFISLLWDPSLFNVVLVTGCLVFAQWCRVQSDLDNLARQLENNSFEDDIVKLLGTGSIIYLNLPYPMLVPARLAL